MALLLLKENICAKLFLNPRITVEVMAPTSSIYDHFIIWPKRVTLTFNLPKQKFQIALLLLKEHLCKIILKSINKCRSYCIDKLIYDHFIIWPSSVTLTFNLPRKFQMTLLLLKNETVLNNFEIYA